MSQRENLFRPIHKGIRSMIYELGLRLGTTDFANVEESDELARQLKKDLSLSVSNCILCLLAAHSQHEEKDFFAAVEPLDPEVVQEMLNEHRVIARRVQDVAKACDELTGISDPERRVELGDRIHLDVSDLFVSYLSHLNNEEALMVPVMWEHFTDEQLRSLRAQFYNQIPLPRFEEWMRWTLPALNPAELLVLLSGMRTDPPPNRFEDALRIAQEMLPPRRWSSVELELRR